MDTAPPTPALLARLRDEEELVRAATAATAAAHAALCSGDPARIAAGHADQELLAARMTEAAAARTEAAEAVAVAVGLSPSGLTLAALAARLPDPAELLAARDRLAAAAAELDAVRRRHATLALHLRSYFRGVLSALTAATTPSRYGPGGALLPPAGTAVQTRG